ncbi:MAG: 16S rRNA (cytidine(1402)-2'-O)-methyltransferase [Acidobacteriota bacterium]
MPGALYLVSTPIGNLRDLSRRAVETLESVDWIACEDTRQTAKLLEFYGIHKPTRSFHEHNEATKAESTIAEIEAGASIALVSDGGTPLVSDPGFRLVRLAAERGIPVIPIPGPSAVLAALAGSGLPTDAFYFGGFLPPKSGARRASLEAVRNLPASLIFFEAPHRVLDSLDDICSVLGDRRIAACRELTKLHEEFLRGSVSQVHATLAARDSIRGEFTLVIDREPPASGPSAPLDLAAEVDTEIARGADRMDAIKTVARRHKMGKRDLYQALSATPGPKKA